MELDLYDFIQGVYTKLAEEGNVFEQTGSVLPNVETQAKWRFARSHSHIRLSDGNIVHSFHLPEGEKDEDFPLLKEEHPIHEFEKDTTSQGTAQVHRADPGSIYFTLQDGKHNPTYTFKHVSETQWRAIPKKHHKTAEIDEQAFIEGALSKLAEGEDQGLMWNILNGLTKGTDAVGRGAIRGVMDLGKNPLAAAGAGLAAGGAYDLGRRAFYNTPEENKEETGLQRLSRYAIPAAALGGAGAAAKYGFPDYYSDYPAFRP